MFKLKIATILLVFYSYLGAEAKFDFNRINKDFSTIKFKQKVATKLNLNQSSDSLIETTKVALNRIYSIKNQIKQQNRDDISKIYLNIFNIEVYKEINSEISKISR